MSTEDSLFSLDRFEFLCYGRDREMAAREFVKLLALLDRQYGDLKGIQANLYALNPDQERQHLLVRVTAALSCLFSDAEFKLSPLGFEQMISWQRWIAALFAASPFVNGDHVLRALNLNGEREQLRLDDDGLFKLCLLYAPDSVLPLDMNALWGYNQRLAVCLAFALMSPRFLGTPAAHGKRETLLAWIAPRLDQVEDLDVLPTAILHDVYMHCSYAEARDKHAIKAPINRLIRRKIEQRGEWPDLPCVVEVAGEVGGKPLLLVVLEWFTGGHSVFRTHSASLRGLRERFHLLGMGVANHVDAAGVEVFDEFVPITGDLRAMLKQVRAVAAERRPAIIYYPSVGMFPLTIYLSNMRLARLQVTALGHAASTLSPFIDRFIVDEDFAGELDLYSERPLLMPRDGMPHVPSRALVAIEPALREQPAVVQIAVPSTTMKLNPRFMAACQAIAARCRVPVHFQFLAGYANGLVSMQVANLLQRYLDHATLNESLPYACYLARLNECDLFLNPFPYGNMNGIVDTTTLGLVGVCREGAHVHECIDAGMFRRLDLPGWLVAGSDQDYIAAAIRLAENHAERLALRRSLLARDAVRVFFEGRPGLLGERLLAASRAAA